MEKFSIFLILALLLVLAYCGLDITLADRFPAYWTSGAIQKLIIPPALILALAWPLGIWKRETPKWMKVITVLVSVIFPLVASSIAFLIIAFFFGGYI